MESSVFERTPSLPGPGEPSGEQAAAGAKTGFSSIVALFETEESPLLRFAIGLVGRRSVAEELVQETFLRLHPIWNEVENPRGWLYRSLRNLALNHLRDHARETELSDTSATTEESLPVEVLGRNEAVGTVRLLLSEMPDEDRRLVELKYRENLKYEEISRRTGLSVGNVGYRLHHVLKSLADSLRRAGIEGSQG
ncbi:RNA polymerase subunit sigma-24 [Opitutaceae bacterium EW11]|nr:RNA polymerase subunit sigma-24 [Opitutaceae bacterium EW11]